MKYKWINDNMPQNGTFMHSNNFFVPRSFYVDQFTFHILLPSLKFAIFIHFIHLYSCILTEMIVWNHEQLHSTEELG